MDSESSSKEDQLVREIMRRDSIIDRLNSNIIDLNKLNEKLGLELMHLERNTSQSIIWNVNKKFDARVVRKIVPTGTHREKIYAYFLKSLKNFIINKENQYYQDNCESIETGNTCNNSRNIEGHSVSYYQAFFHSIIQNATIKSPDYQNGKDFSEILGEECTRLIAFYLPQYHPIPENDVWWGKGFTDWMNVVKAVPQFIGHYQPHLPDELGFYDLRHLEILNRQIELARQYGIFGFCFYYYWFDGKKLLEGPLNQFLAQHDIKFPFCICWANENWTRRWDGHDHEILIAQNYIPGYEYAFIDDLAVILSDSRYIRINGKPVVVVYCAHHLPDPKKTASIWRDHCKEIGIGDLFLIAAQTFGFHDPKPLGFDAAVEFPPHNISSSKNIVHTVNPINPHFSGAILDYSTISHETLCAHQSPYTLFKCVAPGWDNTARRINNPLIIHGSTPALYKKWLIEVMEHTRNTLNDDEQFVFINAWNEWAEGAYLEPDKKFGYSYLNATAEALIDYRNKFR